MNKIDSGFILPSAAFTIKPGQIRYYKDVRRCPCVGDVVYGEILRLGQHSSIENASGRIHTIHDGKRSVFVFGNRYAPDYYEAFVPQQHCEKVDMVARSGVVGIVNTKNSLIKDPTTVKILGYVCDKSGEILNTLKFPLVKPKSSVRKYPRARMILVCGTSMNSGKSFAAKACCWALTSRGYKVRAAKVTGTASLKDILHMNDAGAEPYADFTYLGYPSTYMLDESELLSVFDRLDLKYANNPKNYWVVEFADGIVQRETKILLNSPHVRSRIHKLIFCANDAFGAIGGLNRLESMGLRPDALSGVCTSSPLHVRELSLFTKIPIFDSVGTDADYLVNILRKSAKKRSKKQLIADPSACVG